MLHFEYQKEMRTQGKLTYYIFQWLIPREGPHCEILISWLEKIIAKIWKHRKVSEHHYHKKNERCTKKKHNSKKQNSKKQNSKKSISTHSSQTREEMNQWRSKWQNWQSVSINMRGSNHLVAIPSKERERERAGGKSVQ